MAAEVSPEDRELTRMTLANRAEELKQKYPRITVRQIRRHLHEMITVSI